MEYEELQQGDDRQPSGLSLSAWIGIAVVCVLAGLAFLMLRGPVEPPAQSTPTTTPSPPYPVPPTGLVLISNPPQPVVIRAKCPPVTDGRHWLGVSFTLQNISTQPVTLLKVVPVLPQKGLRVRGPVTAGGSCALPGGQAPGGLLAPGQAQVISMRFRLPKDCAQPYPVQAEVQLRANQMVGTTTVSVLADLGSLEFDACPRS